MVPAHTVGSSSPAALWPTICSLLYRLLIICAHLQRHLAIGYLLPLADLMLSAPSVPAPFDRETRRLLFPFDPSPKITILFSLFFPSSYSVRLYLPTASHYNYQDESHRFFRDLRRVNSLFVPLDQSARRMSVIRKAIRKLSNTCIYSPVESVRDLIEKETSRWSGRAR